MAMNNITRLAVAVPKILAAQPRKNAEVILQCCERLRNQSPELILFPGDTLAGVSCGNLLQNRTVLQGCMDELYPIASQTSDMNCYLFLRIPLITNTGVETFTAVLHSGSVIAIVADWSYAGCLPENTVKASNVFTCGNLRFCIGPTDPEQLLLYAGDIRSLNCDLVVIPSACHTFAGTESWVQQIAQAFTKTCGCALAVANIGPGATSTPYVYRGYAGLFEMGQTTWWESANQKEVYCTYDIDKDLYTLPRQGAFSALSAACGPVPVFSARAIESKRGFLRSVTRSPFLPGDDNEAQQYLKDLFSLQCASLATRMKNTGIEKLVLGVSGGLDSTLALLVCAGAIDFLGLPRQNITGITMPGFGTTDRTYFNALKLLDEMGLERVDISIRAAVTQHFEDIAHDPGVHDTTYENAQARERTQIILDLANQQGALAVGTGDLSEIALGFCTFGGDHLASFNVNSNLPKTILRQMVEHLTQEETFASLADILWDILDTPVSPELLPPDAQGDISQKTEDLLGPYILHDFFLFYFLYYGMEPVKIFEYAKVAFDGEYPAAFIKDKLKLFLRRFFASQFKRTCSTEGAILTEVSLSPFAFLMPGDATPDAFISQLDEFDY